MATFYEGLCTSLDLPEGRTACTQLRADLARLATAATRTGKERAAAFKAAAAETASESYAKGEATLESVLAEMKSLEDELADATRRKPFAALGLAALVGFLCGVMFRR
jgi:ElaB/YqjD/DUF883 family membrane-anchored ribosome-binding protein